MSNYVPDTTLMASSDAVYEGNLTPKKRGKIFDATRRAEMEMVEGYTEEEKVMHQDGRVRKEA